jgi:hypothetical protein
MINSKSKTMKTNSIYLKKAMNVRTIILMLVVLPAISYGGATQNSHLISDLDDQYVISKEERWENYRTDVTTCLSEVSEIDSEEELETEKWMLDVNDISWHDDIIEDEIRIEAWMYSVDSISVSLRNIEEEIEIENWMLTPSSWLGNR